MNRKILAMLMPLAFLLNTLSVSAATYLTEPSDIRFSSANPTQTFTITTDENPSEIDGESGVLKVKLKFPKKLFSSDAPKVIELPYEDGVVDVSEPITLTLKNPDKFKKDKTFNLEINGNKILKKKYRFSNAKIPAAIEVGSTEVSGQVTIPGSSSSSLRRFSTIKRGLSAANVLVELIRVDEFGNQIGDALVTTSTNSNGEYNLDLPEGFVFGTDLVLRVVVNGNEMRAFVSDDKVDIDPYSEYIYRECQENTDSLRNLSSEEINALTTLIKQFAVDIQDSLDISISNFEEIIGDFIINMIIAANDSNDDFEDEDLDEEDEDEELVKPESLGDKYFVAFFDTGLAGPKTEYSDASTRATMELARAKFSKPNAVGSMKVKGFPVLIAEAELHKSEEFAFDGPPPFPGEGFEDFGPGGPEFGPGGPEFGPGTPPPPPSGTEPFAGLLNCDPATDPNCTNPPPQECFDPAGNKIPCDGGTNPPPPGDCGVDEFGNPIPCPPTECTDEFGNPIPCENHDPCKDIPPNTSVFFNNGTGFVECPPPQDPCADLPPPTEAGTFPNFDDGSFTECPPPQDPCAGGFEPGPFDPKQPFFEDGTGFIDCPPIDPCENFGNGFEDFEPFFEDGQFAGCTPPKGDPCFDGGFGPGPNEPFFEGDDFDRFKDDNFECSPEGDGPGFGFGPTHFLRAFTFDPSREKRGSPDPGVDEFFVNVSPANVISFIEPARDDIFFDRRDEFVFKNNAVKESFYPVGKGMYLSSSTHGGQLFRNGQLIETKQEFGFGAMVQESNLGPSALAGKYGMVSLGIDLAQTGRIGILGLTGDVDINSSGRAIPNFDEIEIARDRDYENFENTDSITVEMPEFTISRTEGFVGPDEGGATLSIRNGKVNMKFDDLGEGEAEIFEGYVRPDGDVIVFVSKNDRTDDFGKGQIEKSRGRGLDDQASSASREVTFAVRRGESMTTADLANTEYVVLCHNIRVEASELVTMSTCDDTTSRLSFSAGQAEFSGVSLKTASRADDEAIVSFSKVTGPSGVASSTSLASNGELEITVGNVEMKGYASVDGDLLILRAENGNELGLYIAIKKPVAPVKAPRVPRGPNDDDIAVEQPGN